MRARWLLNLFLLLLVAGIGLFIYLRPPPEEGGPVTYKLTEIRPDTVSRISVELPARAPVQLEKRDGNWYMTQPHEARASAAYAGQVLKLLHASSSDRFPAEDLARFGLDQPRLRLSLGEAEFSFGTFNPVTSQQYVAHAGFVYLVDTVYGELAATQPLEMLDKNLLGPLEHIAGFDFSRLEQWEQSGLALERDGDHWKVTTEGPAKPDQNELREWFAGYWAHPAALAVEPYKPEPREQYPSFKVKLQDGRVVHFDKLQESPQLLLARPDEGLLYRLRADIGFVLLNPPVGFKND